jgi:hypothetical protein
LFEGNLFTMEPFLAILYIHVIATLGLVAAMGAEGLALGQFRRAAEQQELAFWVDPIRAVRAVASICLIVLFLSGGYLTDRVGLWRMAWPKIAVAIIVAFGSLAGLSSRRLRRIRRAYAQGALPNAEVMRHSQAPFLRVSLSIRTGLVLAAVWLMTAKPNLPGSLGIVLAFVIISWGLAALIKPGSQRRSAAAAGPEFDHSAR